jgi:hypothetical protein
MVDVKNAAEKRRKEIDRKKYQAEKAERRHQRQLEREARAASGGDDPDLAGIVPGPQPTVEASPSDPAQPDSEAKS